MNEANTGYLLRTFPSFFNPEDPLGSPPSEIGFECGDGWFELIKTLCEKLRSLNMPNFQVTGVRQKSIRLWFIYVGVPRGQLERVNTLVKEAEGKSLEICEICGKPGKVTRNQRIPSIGFVLCTDCSSYER